MQIARYLNSKNIIPRKKNKWSYTSIYNILTNSLYCGARKYKGELIEAPAIITANTFFKAKEKLNSRASNGGGKHIHSHLLNNAKLVCGVCGRHFNPLVAKNYTYYRCNSTAHGNINCGNKGIEKNFIETVITHIVTNKFPNLITNHINVENFDNDIQTINTEINDYNDYIIREKKKENNLIDMRTDSIISKEELISKIAPIRNEITNLNSKIKALKNDLIRIEELKENKLNIETILNNWKLKGVDNAMIRQIINKVIINTATEEELNPDSEPILITEDDNTITYEPNDSIFINKFSDIKSKPFKLSVLIYGLSIDVYCSNFKDFYLCQGEYINFR